MTDYSQRCHQKLDQFVESLGMRRLQVQNAFRCAASVTSIVSQWQSLLRWWIQSKIKLNLLSLHYGFILRNKFSRKLKPSTNTVCWVPSSGREQPGFGFLEARRGTRKSCRAQRCIINCRQHVVEQTLTVYSSCITETLRPLSNNSPFSPSLSPCQWPF